MFRNLPIFFDAPDDGGSGAPAGEPAGEPVVVTDPPAGEPAATDPPAGEPVVTDPFAEFGGQDSVRQAIELDRALQTREGMRGLVEEAGKMLYGTDPARAALLQQLLADEAAAPAADPLADILSDPERLLTPDEVAKVVDVRVQQAIEKVLGEHVAPLEERQAADSRAAVERSVESALVTLEVPEAAQRSVLGYADQYINDVDMQSPAKVTDAIRRGLADWQADMEKQARAYLEGKKTVAEAHPTTLKSGGAPGGTDAVEPQNEEEAIAAVRQSILGRT